MLIIKHIDDNSFIKNKLDEYINNVYFTDTDCFYMYNDNTEEINAIFFGHKKEHHFHITNTIFIEFVQDKVVSKYILIPTYVDSEIHEEFWTKVYTNWLHHLNLCIINSVKRICQIQEFSKQFQWSSVFRYKLNTVIDNMYPNIKELQNGITHNNVKNWCNLILNDTFIKHFNIYFDTKLQIIFVLIHNNDEKYLNELINILIDYYSKEFNWILIFNINANDYKSIYMNDYIPKTNYLFDLHISQPDLQNYTMNEYKAKLIYNEMNECCHLIINKPCVLMSETNEFKLSFQFMHHHKTIFVKFNEFIQNDSISVLDDIDSVYNSFLKHSTNDRVYSFHIKQNEIQELLHIQNSVLNIQRQWLNSYYCPDYKICTQIRISQFQTLSAFI